VMLRVGSGVEVSMRQAYAYEMAEWPWWKRRLWWTYASPEQRVAMGMPGR